jgi:hypothetical protein
MSLKDFPALSSHLTLLKSSNGSAQLDLTVVLSTLTSRPTELKLAVRLVEKKRLVEVVKVAATAGNNIAVVVPAQSTILANFHWLKALTLDKYYD